MDAPSFSLRSERKRRAVAEAPPLGVGHLLLWMACCALYLAALRALSERPPGTMGLLIASALAIGYGAAWAGLAVFVRRRVSHKIYRIEPGEWLLAVLGARLAVEVAVQFAPSWLLASPRGVVAAATCFFLALPLLSRALPTPWKAALATMLLLHVLPLAAFAVREVFGLSIGPLAATIPWIEPAQTPLSLFALLAVAAFDVWKKRRSTWLHWTGVLGWLWMLLVGMLFRQ